MPCLLKDALLQDALLGVLYINSNRLVCCCGLRTWVKYIYDHGKSVSSMSYIHRDEGTKASTGPSRSGSCCFY